MCNIEQLVNNGSVENTIIYRICLSFHVYNKCLYMPFLMTKQIGNCYLNKWQM